MKIYNDAIIALNNANIDKENHKIILKALKHAKRNTGYDVEFVREEIKATAQESFVKDGILYYKKNDKYAFYKEGTKKITRMPIWLFNKLKEEKENENN